MVNVLFEIDPEKEKEKRKEIQSRKDKQNIDTIWKEINKLPQPFAAKTHRPREGNKVKSEKIQN